MDRPAFEILEHTADVGLRVRGRTLPELFANAGLGLMALALESPECQPLEELPLGASGSDLEELLFNWLSEILYFVDAEGWRFCRFELGPWEAGRIAGQGFGERSDPAQRTRAVAVKAVTYHQLSVRETPDGWEAVVYFDI